MRRFIVDRFSYEKIRSAEGESHMNQCRKIRIVQGQRSLKVAQSILVILDPISPSCNY